MRRGWWTDRHADVRSKQHLKLHGIGSIIRGGTKTDAQDRIYENRKLVTKIMHLRRNKLQASELNLFISTVYEALVRLGKPAAAEASQTPAPEYRERRADIAKQIGLGRKSVPYEPTV
jgi:predicted transcriptional regulator